MFLLLVAFLRQVSVRLFSDSEVLNEIEVVGFAISNTLTRIRVGVSKLLGMLERNQSLVMLLGRESIALLKHVPYLLR